MATAHKPRPEYLDHAAVEAMIAEAITAERQVQAANQPLTIRTYPTFRKK